MAADQMECDYLTERDGPKGIRANDYMYGFDTQGDFATWYLGTTASSGWAAEDDLEELMHYSLLRGLEEWYQMLCCANAMREKASFDDPLDGQDLLTFLSKILLPSAGGVGEGIREQISEVQHQSEDLAKGYQSAQLNASPHQTSKKRKDRWSQPADSGPSKKHKKDKESPFWSKSRDQPSTQQLTQSTDERKRLKKARRKLRKAKTTLEASGPKTTSASPPTESPVLVLRDATIGHLNEDNIATHKFSRDGDSQESVCGYDILRKPPLPNASEAGESPEDSKTPLLALGNDVEVMPVAAKPDLEITGEDDMLREQETAPQEKDDDKLPMPAQIQTPKRKAKSPYFDVPDASSPLKAKSPRPPRGTVPCIPFPRLDAPRFGLIQEELAADPFRLLIAVTFLIRTKGKQAIPVFRQLIGKYPTPRDLAEADTGDLVIMIKHLGLGEVRTAAIQKYARIWMEDPPQADVRYGVKNYPRPGNGADVRSGEVLSADDPRLSAWEIGHMTQGRYAIDSWRIFCRDVLLGLAEDWRGKGREGEFQPEWMRVLPEDKELRAYLRWLWMQEGWLWDARTGEREVLPEDLRRAVDENRVSYDDAGELKILDKEDEAVGGGT
ncbi:hypothetical protein AAE478_002416 [Parahypoxylon ruwenzoriense]